MPLSARNTALTALISALSCSAYAAQEQGAEETQGGQFSGDAKLGFIYSKTDSTSMSINSGATLNYDEEMRKQKLSLATYYSHKSDSDDDDDGTNKYRVIYDIKHTLSQSSFVFGNAKYEHDQYATYRHQALLVGGFGYTLLDTETSKLEVGAGPGFRYSKRQSFDEDYPNRSEDEIIANGFINGSLKVSDALDIGGGVRMDYGDSNTTTTANAYLKNKLAEKLALVLDTEYIYNTEVASGKDHDEIYSTISLNYAF